MAHLMSRNLGCLIGGVERCNTRFLIHNVAVASLGRGIVLSLQLRVLPSMILATSLFFLSSIPLVASEVVGLDALLELDLNDWSSVYPETVIDQCTLALTNPNNLKEGQICRLYILRAVAMKLNGKPEVAVRDLTEALKIHPNDCQALRVRGETYCMLGKFEKGRTDFEALLKIQPKSGIGHACLALCLSECGHKDDSLRLAEKAISLDPDEPLGYLARAEAYLRNNDYQNGLKDLNQCINLSLDAGKPIAKRSYLMRAATFLNFYDDTKKALSDLLMARRLDPYDKVVKGMFCEYYFKTGRYNMALHLSEELIRSQRIGPDLLGRRVDCLLQQQKNDAALQVAESIVRQAPMSWSSYVFRGEVFLSLKNYRDALQDYDKSLSLRHDNIVAMAAKSYLLATCPKAQFRDGQTARILATKCCERTQYQVPRQLMLLAMACAECKDYKEAVRCAKMSLEKADANFPFLEDYRQRLKLFEQSKPYRFSPDSAVFDYLCP